jgi:hypothetical protein
MDEKEKGPVCAPPQIQALQLDERPARIIATHRTVKLIETQKRALADVARRRRSGATLQQLANHLHVGRLDVARLLEKYTRRNRRDELILRGAAP